MHILPGCQRNRPISYRDVSAAVVYEQLKHPFPRSHSPDSAGLCHLVASVSKCENNLSSWYPSSCGLCKDNRPPQGLLSVLYSSQGRDFSATLGELTHPYLFMYTPDQFELVTPSGGSSLGQMPRQQQVPQFQMSEMVPKLKRLHLTCC